MTIAMQPIYTQTVGSGGATSITFNNIPQTFTDLKVLISSRELSTSNFTLEFQFNGSGLNRTLRFIQGNGTTTSSTSISTFSFITNGNTSTANTFGNAEIYIPNYTGSAFKSFIIDSVSENNATLSFQRLTAGLWSNTAAITSITFGSGIAENSTVTLYGITKG
jgi:hypothetical protein